MTMSRDAVGLPDSRRCARRSVCHHCGEALAASDAVRVDGDCALLLQRLRRRRGVDPRGARSTTTTACAARRPAASTPMPADFGAWDRDVVLAEHSRAVPGGREITVLTDAMRCAACAWLIDRALRRHAGRARRRRQRRHRPHHASPGIRSAVALSALMSRLAALGYRPWLATGDAREQAQTQRAPALADPPRHRRARRDAGDDVRRGAVPGHRAADVRWPRAISSAGSPSWCRRRWCSIRAGRSSKACGASCAAAAWAWTR